MVTPALVLAAVLAVVGGVVAVAAPDPRHATAGAVAATLLGAVVADPQPSAAVVVARAAGAGLAGWLVWMSLRGAPRASARSAFGWPGSAGLAVGAFAIGWLAASSFGALVAVGVADGLVAGVPGATLAGGSLGARSGIAAAAALGVLAVPTVVLPRDGLRLGLGILLLLVAAGLLANALGAAPDDAFGLALAVLTAVAGAALAGTTAALLRASGDLVLRDPRGREPAVRHRPADDAHRGPAR